MVQPALAFNAVYLQARLISTSSGAKGGALSRDRVVGGLGRVLRERNDTYITTFFDLYGLPGGFPGRAEPERSSDPIARCQQIEAALHGVVVEQAGCRQERFLPHIQPYEFEALLLSDMGAFARAEAQWHSVESELASVVNASASPEHVNDGFGTHPSARLKHAIPGYRKVTHGVRLATQIGLDRIRSECHHFGAWLGRMESLQPLNPGRSR
ncbi:MAG: DUF4276 family protein [Gammaproteobacteria bacterium]|nr:DUF4276 family protein [Gammaproteobacteria bacterium]